LSRLNAPGRLHNKKPLAFHTFPHASTLLLWAVFPLLPQQAGFFFFPLKQLMVCSQHGMGDPAAAFTGSEASPSLPPPGSPGGERFSRAPWPPASGQFVFSSPIF
jgi:hypothetical protein